MGTCIGCHTDGETKRRTTGGGADCSTGNYRGDLWY
jgi:hypothetical protein